MASHLQLVGNTTPPTLTPRVLTPELQHLLHQLNDAERELRRMGCVIEWRALGDPIPRIHLHRDPAVSLMPVFDRLQTRRFRQEGTAMLVIGVFMGVMVSWDESILEPELHPTHEIAHV
jgi:hypothetical protein